MSYRIGAKTGLLIIEYAKDKGSFKRSDIEEYLKKISKRYNTDLEKVPSKTSISRVFQELEKEGWIRREDENSKSWVSNVRRKIDQLKN